MLNKLLFHINKWIKVPFEEFNTYKVERYIKEERYDIINELLLNAVKENNIEIIQKIVDEGHIMKVNPNIPLIEAVSMNNEPAVIILLTHPMIDTTFDNFKAFNIAIMNKNPNILKHLFKDKKILMYYIDTVMSEKYY